MAGGKSVKLHNKSDKPDNIILKEHEIVSKCEEIQEQLPDFLKGFFRYLKGDVLSKTRFAYLGDIHFFCRYLIEETDLTEATDPADIKKAEFNKIKASDINEFLDHCREYRVKQNGQDVLYQNGSRTLARKKSSLSVLCCRFCKTKRNHRHYHRCISERFLRISRLPRYLYQVIKYNPLPCHELSV